ncbi:MAG: ATP-binding cassette domain-containing protein, partial [Sphingomonadales bacterium]
HRLSHYPAQLSGGEHQRVALARAIAPEPTRLFADEPTGNLDTKTGAQVIDIMMDLHAKRGMTLILITHDLDLAARCQRMIEMRDGEIAGPQPEAIAAQ